MYADISGNGIFFVSIKLPISATPINVYHCKMINLQHDYTSITFYRISRADSEGFSGGGRGGGFGRTPLDKKFHFLRKF